MNAEFGAVASSQTDFTAVIARRLMVLLGTAVVLFDLRLLVEGSTWLRVSLSAALAGLLASLVLRFALRQWGTATERWAWVTWAGGLTSVLTGAAVALVVALRDLVSPTLAAGVVPTVETVRVLRDQIDRSLVTIAEEPPPVPGQTGVVVMVIGAALALVVVADLVVDRRLGVVVIGAGWAVALAVPPAVLAESADPAPWLAAAVVWLVLLALSSREVSASAWRPAAGLVVAAGLVGVVALPGLVPEPSRADDQTPDAPVVFGTGINPVLQLGRDLRRTTPVVALTYRTTALDVPYLKVATLADFTAQAWEPIEDEPAIGAAPEGRDAIDPSITQLNVSTTVRVEQLRSTYLPVPYAPLSLEVSAGTWDLQPTGLTYTSDDDDTRGLTYTVTSVETVPTAQQLRAVQRTTDPRVVASTVLPADRPAIIGQTARAVTEGATNDYDRVLALQDFLRNGDFRYSERTPVSRDYDGTGLQALAAFLEVKSGYCVHFSSGMAVMARELGIPARVAVGYAPGAPVIDSDGERAYQVDSDDLHAWTEIYFAGVGWVRFDPTPGIGTSTRFEEPAIDDVAEQVVPPVIPPSAAPAPAPPVADDVAAATTPSTAAAALWVWLAAGFGVLVAAAVSTPGLVRRAIRRRRLAGGVDDQWAEVLATADDLKIDLPTAGTPRQIAAAIAGRPGIDQTAVADLLTAVESSWFAGTPQEVEPSATVRVLGGLTGGVGRRARWRAAWWPRSMMTRVRPRVARVRAA